MSTEQPKNPVPIQSPGQKIHEKITDVVGEPTPANRRQLKADLKAIKAAEVPAAKRRGKGK